MAHYDHNCVNGNCDAYDRVGGVRVRNYRGEWMELFRYITPFGKQCEDDLDITDYTSVLQGLVEFELYFETWSGSGYNPNLTFTYTKGAPEYLYADVVKGVLFILLGIPLTLGIFMPMLRKFGRAFSVSAIMPTSNRFLLWITHLATRFRPLN